jgi:FAD-dependent urate hydroxylase
VSWKFVDAYVESTTNVSGYWRNLPKSEQDAIAHPFWDVGRLTLEYWLTPRLEGDSIHRWPGTEVVETLRAPQNEVLRLGLPRRPGARPIPRGNARPDPPGRWLPGARRVVWDQLTGLYITGFSAVRDFGPCFGFIKGCPAAATLVVRNLLSRKTEPSPRESGADASARGPRHPLTGFRCLARRGEGRA